MINLTTSQTNELHRAVSILSNYPKLYGYRAAARALLGGSDPTGGMISVDMQIATITSQVECVKIGRESV